VHLLSSKIKDPVLNIITKLSEADLIRFTFYTFYKNWIIRFITVMMILSIIIRIIYPKAIKNDTSVNTALVLIFLIVLPILIYVKAKRNYNTNQRIRERIEYEFSDTDLKIAGESFNSTMSWDKVFKVTKTKRWVIIWQTKYLANIIPIQDIWQGEMERLKEILQRRRVSNNL
jgi:hypothetical protein